MWISVTAIFAAKHLLDRFRPRAAMPQQESEEPSVLWFWFFIIRIYCVAYTVGVIY